MGQVWGQIKEQIGNSLEKIEGIGLGIGFGIGLGIRLGARWGDSLIRFGARFGCRPSLGNGYDYKLFAEMVKNMKAVTSQFIKQVHQLHSEVRGQINTWQGAQIEN